MSSRRAVALTIACASSCMSCVADTGLGAELPAADYALFVENVQPILAEDCGNPSCHGDPRRPLALFAVRRHRLDEQEVYRDTPLTEEELQHNHARATAFLVDLERAEDSLLLSKPLAPEAGGAGHAGGAQFSDTADWGYAQLLGWAERVVRAAQEEP